MNIIDLMAEAIEQGWSFDRIDKELYPLIKQAQKDRLVGFMLEEEFDGLFKQPEQEPSCAECGAGGGHALYCVACAEKFVGGYKEQEPVAFLTNRRQRLTVEFNATGFTLMPKSVDWKIPLYTTPPQRTWIGLTDEEVSGLWEMAQIFNQPKHFYLLVEAELKEKNT